MLIFIITSLQPGPALFLLYISDLVDFIDDVRVLSNCMLMMQSFVVHIKDYVNIYHCWILVICACMPICLDRYLIDVDCL